MHQPEKLSSGVGLWVWIVGALIVLGGLYMFVQGGQQESAMTDQDDAMMQSDAKMMQPDAMEPTDGLPTDQAGEGAMTQPMEDAMMAKAGKYVAYDPAKLAMAQEGKVILFFRASWCPTCRALDADIKTNAQSIPAGVAILDVDYDQYGDLKKKYGVTYQHTLVQVDAQGNELKQWSGSPKLADLLEELR